MQLTMKPIKSICVFCGSGSGVNPLFEAAASELGNALADKKFEIIYGGGDTGLMGALAKSALSNNGHVTGIIPEFLMKYQNGGIVHSEQIITSTMHERKAKMHEMADSFLALPGGIGTLEELVETMTWEQLGQHEKPIYLLNIDRFWNPFLTLLEHMREEQFIRGGLELRFKIIDSVNDLMQAIELENTAKNQGNQLSHQL